MITKTLFPGKYVQGYNALEELSNEIKSLGSKGLLLVDSYVNKHVLPQMEFLKEAPIQIEEFQGECCDSEINRLIEICKSNQIDVVVGMGGGKTLDTAKAVAHFYKTPVIIVPTLASTDAPCSALSVIYSEKGEFDRYLVLPHNPNVVIVDSKLISQAPVRFLVSGIGDALSTWLEAESCKTSFRPNMTGFVGSLTAYALAELCFDTLLEYGYQAKLACEAKVVTPALEHIIEANTLLSGLGFESGGLASSHAIHNGLTALEETHKYFHGEKVAIGSLASLFITDKPTDFVNMVFDFCAEVGLPTTLADIGLEDVSDEDLMKVATLACASGETIHNEAKPITPEVVFAALRAMDAYGQAR